MPLTEFQRTVLRLLAGCRGPESFVAGGTVINAGADSPRYSDDVDIFHDAEEAVAHAAATDIELLSRSGFALEWLLRRPGFQRAVISRDGQNLRLEWTQDSAFRFFPVQPDPEFGWRLHLADIATNKVLALAGRWEVRDFVDMLYLDDRFASLGLLTWAAAGKDVGLTPMLILEQAARFNRLRSEDFLAVLGTDQFDFVAMKTRWRQSLSAATELVASLPPKEVGALYLDANGRPADPRSGPITRAHYASLGGALPRIVESATLLPGEIEREAEDELRKRYRHGP
jgi:hypothetical protein